MIKVLIQTDGACGNGRQKCGSRCGSNCVHNRSVDSKRTYFKLPEGTDSEPDPCPRHSLKFWTRTCSGFRVFGSSGLVKTSSSRAFQLILKINRSFKWIKLNHTLAQRWMMCSTKWANEHVQKLVTEPKNRFGHVRLWPLELAHSLFLLVQ